MAAPSAAVGVRINRQHHCHSAGGGGHPGHQIVVDPLGLTVQSRIQQFVGRLFVRQHDGRIPLGSDRLQDGSVPVRLIDVRSNDIANSFALVANESGVLGTVDSMHLP